MCKRFKMKNDGMSERFEMKSSIFVMTMVIALLSACGDASDGERVGEGPEDVEQRDDRRTGGGEGPTGSWENDDVVSPDDPSKPSSGDGAGGSGDERTPGDGSGSGGSNLDGGSSGSGGSGDGGSGGESACTSPPSTEGHCVCGDFRA